MNKYGDEVVGFYTVIAVPRIYEILKNSDVISHCILGNIPLGMNITTSMDISLSRNRQIDRFSYVMSFCQVVICTSTAPDRSSLVMRAQNASRIIFPSILNLVLEESACCFFSSSSVLSLQFHHIYFQKFHFKCQKVHF